jgi:hypothetical protein
LRAVVTGTGRCGTVYMARLLTTAGLPCGHESIFTPGGLEEAVWRLEGARPVANSNNMLTSGEADQRWQGYEHGVRADASYMAAPYLACRAAIGDAQVVHLVRSPLQVITSFVHGKGYFRSSMPVYLDTETGTIEACGYQKFIYSTSRNWRTPVSTRPPGRRSITSSGTG